MPHLHLNMVDITVQPRLQRCLAVFDLGAEFVVSAHNYECQLIIMNCAVDGGLLAATLGLSASHASSWQGARPFTTRGTEEGGSWFQERNGTKSVKHRLGTSGCQKYWGALRPRPRLHRRHRRRQATNIVQAALGHQEACTQVQYQQHCSRG